MFTSSTKITARLPICGPNTPLRRRSSFDMMMFCVWFADVCAEKFTKNGTNCSFAISFSILSCTYTDLPVPVGPTNSSGLHSARSNHLYSTDNYTVLV